MTIGSLVGIDTGGTFTDAVSAEGKSAKVPSTPADPAGAVEAVLRRVSDRRPEYLAHGTTVATNALLERKGATVALITNRGFADVIEIARQDRPSLYDQWKDRPEPLVPRPLRCEVDGRLDASGVEIEPLGEPDLSKVPSEVRTVAVCLLHSDLNDAHERRLGEILTETGYDPVLSVDVSPEFREYERTVTTVVNAYLRPLCSEYMRRVGKIAETVVVMTSAGGLTSAEEASCLPVSLLLSGPAGGVRAAANAALSSGFPDAVSLDMGGTSTDVGLISGGVPEPAPGRVVGGFPIRMPSLDIHTIGAGGGSIARIDSGGALVVGPESAGAVPGPACYGRGGVEPTVTDADFLSKRIPAGIEFPGIGKLDAGAAADACARASVTPEGVISVVNANMERAIRTMTVERGRDPREMALIAFGGAGPLHACDLAESLGMQAVIVPPRAGVLSAVGLICSPRQRQLVRSWGGGDDLSRLDTAVRQLADDAAALVRRGNTSSAEPSVQTFLDCRYRGQSHELTVRTVDEFHAEHLARNGYSRPETPVEVVAIRARASLPAPVEYASLPTTGRSGTVVGPDVIAEDDTTIWIPRNWVATVGPDDSWVVRRKV